MVTISRYFSDTSTAARAGSTTAVRLSKTPVIAIVDDDEAVREAFCDLLQVEGLSARTFDSAVTFLAEYTPDRFDYVVTDVRMPEIDGIEMQQRLRALGASIPVIFITSATDAATRQRALAGGAIAWFTKPVADESAQRFGRRRGRSGGLGGSPGCGYAHRRRQPAGGASGRTLCGARPDDRPACHRILAARK